MKVLRMGSESKVRLLRTRVLGVCMLTGVIVIAIAIRPEVRTTFAQSTEPQAAPPTATSDAAGGANAQVPSQDQAAKAPVTDSTTNPPKKQIALDSADLLKMANELKVSMDKFTPDTLSLAIIRQADGIEKLAHKMRSR
jgi:hypothetical protein